MIYTNKVDKRSINGLTQAEVRRKQTTGGYNEMPDREKKGFVAIGLETLAEPMILLLIAVVVVYFLLGDKREAAVLLVSVLVIVTIELFQNRRTEKALEALRNLASPSCEVIRDGKTVTVPSRELVVGDMVIVAEGTRVPADARLLSAENIQADESLLTGESVPVDKDESSEKSRDIFSGSMIVKGHGVAEVLSIGADTEIGKIGRSLGEIKSEKTLLEKEVGGLVKKIAIFAVAASMLLALVYWLTRGSLLHGFLAGLTLSIAILPEEFPVVLTVFMALGSWRLAKNNVLTRRNRTIETLGSASVLCTDKTGTLTENKMKVEQVTDRHGDPVAVDSDQYQTVIAYGILASQVDPFDPMEEAFIEAATWTNDLKTIYDDNMIVKEYPLEAASLSVVHVWAGSDGDQRFVALKGAPEAVFELCHLSDAETNNLKTQIRMIARQGLRVLAVAKGTPRRDIPEDRSAYEYEFLGLVALADPIRPEAAPAVALCRQAGIRVIMITGDYAETARRIGHEIGLDSDSVVTGEELAAMSPEQQAKTIRTTSIFSRVTPDNKLVIVNALKHDHQVVAMTGDGVNDAPALKSAHIGIAMGKRGTDVAREAASIVLLDDNFSSIVHGIRLGRRIFGNLQKAMTYILVVHMPIIMLSLLPVFFGWPLVLLPIHIVFLEFIIDPSCTLVFENESEDPDAMHKPPRRLRHPLFSKELLISSVLTGMVISTAIILSHWWMLSEGWATEKSRAVTFLLIVITNILMIVTISGRRAVKEAFVKVSLSPLPVVLIVVTAALTAIYSVPGLRSLFKITQLDFYELGVVLTLSAAIALMTIVVKKVYDRYFAV